MAIFASINMSFAAIVGALALVLSGGAVIILTRLVHTGTERRIRRLNDVQRTFGQHVGAAIAAQSSHGQQPSANE